MSEPRVRTDEMGYEHYMLPGGVEMESTFGQFVARYARTLTRGGIERMLDEMWEREHPYRELREVFPPPPDPDRAACGAVLYPLPTDIWEPAIWRGQVVDPVIARMIGPMQGPQPAACARKPHPDSPYHWDGRGTWWQ